MSQNLRHLICFAVFAGMGLASSTLSAQGTTRRGDEFRSPTVSPYLDLLRQDSGYLPNYHTFVRPKIETRRQQIGQWQSINQLQRRVSTFQQQGEIRPTGQGGYFNNYLHYYQMGSGRR